jgi:GTP-binding protein LepA
MRSSSLVRSALKGRAPHVRWRRWLCSAAPPADDVLYASRLRNISICAHVDAGKSTLSDVLLRETGAVSEAQIAANPRFLDGLSVERERGITVQLRAARMRWGNHIINIVDTPGHCDFASGVLQSLQAVDGVLLLVDATKGVQAQTLANLELARAKSKVVLPIVSKCDLETADVDACLGQLMDLLPDGVDPILTSARTGAGVVDVLDAVVRHVPPASAFGDASSALQAIVFDSFYCPYRGIVVLCRIQNGSLRAGDELRILPTSGKTFTVEAVGYLSPHEVDAAVLSAGDVGFVTAGSTPNFGATDVTPPMRGICANDIRRPLTSPSTPVSSRCHSFFSPVKTLGDAPVGCTLVGTGPGASNDALDRYTECAPVVWMGLFPTEPNDFAALRRALQKLKLTDASLVFEVDTSPAMGTGFRCGFSGLLHGDVVQQRLEDDFDLDLIASSPSVSYHVLSEGETEWSLVSNPAEVPDGAKVKEPIASVDILCRDEDVGAMIQLSESRRGEMVDQAYVGTDRVRLSYRIPLIEVVADLYDAVKHKSSGYATMEFRTGESREGALARMDFVIAGEKIDGLSMVVDRAGAFKRGSAVVKKLREQIPRHNFKVRHGAPGRSIRFRGSFCGAGR